MVSVAGLISPQCTSKNLILNPNAKMFKLLIKKEVIRPLSLAD